MATYTELGLYIDGKWSAGSEGRSEPVINPANEQVLGHVPHASKADLDLALAAAQRAFPLWRDTPLETRTKILLTAARMVRERAPRIGEIMTLEQGKALTEARGEATRVAGTLQWDAEEARRAYGRIIPYDATSDIHILKQPVGPVAAFTPWNFPAGSPMRKIAAAVSAGCSIVIKASEETPGTACELVRCFEEAGLPPGVLNLVFGVPTEVSQHLITSPITRMVAFTGSIPVGKQLASLAASLMKPNMMELGGHAPVIVCADADPVHAAKTAAVAKFINAGQVCTSPSRFLVHESIAEKFTATLVEAATSLKVGDGLEAGVQMGPLANARRLAAVEAMVADAVERGAKVLCGGRRIGTRGFFYEPTVLTNVPDASQMMCNEPFGPVAPIRSFASLDEAIDIANSLQYGLAAYAYTKSTSTANTLMRKLEAGIMSINHCGGSVVEAPSGGVKESGYGREGGAEGLEGYLITKRVFFKY